MNKVVTIVRGQMFHALQKRDRHPTGTASAGLGGLAWYIYSECRLNHTHKNYYHGKLADMSSA